MKVGLNKAIFLDRDGVINRELGRYTSSVDEFEILPDLLDSLEIFRDKGYLLFVITNQGGIAKGIYTHADLHDMHNYFLGACNERGVRIEEIYYSPHHEITGKSLSRKPGSLMLERAVSKYKINPERSLMIGDSDRDIEAAQAVNIPGVKIPSNSSIKTLAESLD